MIRSMTGFGQDTQSLDNETVTVEIKTLNSKFLDLAYKAPRLISDKEIEIRNIITNELVRGKVSFSIQLEQGTATSKSLDINRELFDKYLQEYRNLEQQTGREFKDILKLSLDSPDVLKQVEESISSDSWANIHKAIKAAVKHCNESRAKEGEKLAEVLSSYIEAIRKSLKTIKEIEPKRLVKIKERIKSQVEELMQSKDYDKERLEQELIYYSEKLDINEETERLAIHLDSFLSVLKSKKENQHGKKLGFISQEIGREINTIGSKANDADVQSQVILMKEELEKIKEQTLNIL